MKILKKYRYYEEISKYTQKKIYNIIFNDSDFLMKF